MLTQCVQPLFCHFRNCDKDPVEKEVVEKEKYIILLFASKQYPDLEFTYHDHEFYLIIPFYMPSVQAGFCFASLSLSSCISVLFLALF